ncbi:hypothetical protein [Terrisporobacter sp.]
MAYRELVSLPYYERESLPIVVTVKNIHSEYDLFTIHDNIPLKLKLSPEENREEDMLEIRNHINLWREKNIKRIFLVGNDLFSLNFQRLQDMEYLVHKYFSKCNTIGCFSSVKDIESKTNCELKKLHEIGYDKLTIPMEINENTILKYMKDGYKSDEIIEQCTRLDEAKISYNLFYKRGVFSGEEEKFEEKLISDICSELHPINIINSTV